jgi:hypothetical protein
LAIPWFCSHEGSTVHTIWNPLTPRRRQTPRNRSHGTGIWDAARACWGSVFRDGEVQPQEAGVAWAGAMMAIGEPATSCVEATGALVVLPHLQPPVARLHRGSDATTAKDCDGTRPLSSGGQAPPSGQQLRLGRRRQLRADKSSAGQLTRQSFSGSRPQPPTPARHHHRTAGQSHSHSFGLDRAAGARPASLCRSLSESRIQAQAGTALRPFQKHRTRTTGEPPGWEWERGQLRARSASMRPVRCAWLGS